VSPMAGKDGKDQSGQIRAAPHGHPACQRCNNARKATQAIASSCKTRCGRFRSAQICSCKLPVEQVVDYLPYVLFPPVLIVQVIRVLPHVQREKGGHAL